MALWGLAQEDCSRIKQGESMALRVLLGLGAWLRCYHRDVAPAAGGVEQASRQERRLHTATAMLRQGGRTAELGDPPAGAKTGATGDSAVEASGVKCEIGDLRHIRHHLRERVAREHLVGLATGNSVGMSKAGDYGVDPRIALHILPLDQAKPWGWGHGGKTGGEGLVEP